MKIGYQGIAGSYSEEALIKYYPRAKHIPFKTFDDLVQAALNEEINLALLPIENTTGGSIKRSYYLIIENDLFINAEINHSIHHCLLANPNTNKSKIKYAMSHPEALLQCRKYLNSHNLTPREFRDTAESALYISQHKYKSIAAIASQRCAKLYNLQILDKNIEDASCNTTRFLLLSKNFIDNEPTKLTAKFKLPHTPGSLYSALEVLAINQFNLTKIESCPIPNEPYHYDFVIDVDIKQKDWKKIIHLLKTKTIGLKVLGVYSPLNT